MFAQGIAVATKERKSRLQSSVEHKTHLATFSPLGQGLFSPNFQGTRRCLDIILPSSSMVVSSSFCAVKLNYHK